MALQLFKIADVTVASPVASVTFSSIPSGYTDLKLVASVRSSESTAYGGIYIAINGTTYNSTGRALEGDGSAKSSYTFTTGQIGFIAGAGSTANTFGSTEVYIPNYTSSNYKSYSSDGVGENNATTALAQLVAGLSTDTTAITSISLKPYSTNTFSTNSTFTLYGVL